MADGLGAAAAAPTAILSALAAGAASIQLWGSVARQRHPKAQAYKSSFYTNTTTYTSPTTTASTNTTTREPFGRLAGGRISSDAFRKIL